MLKTFTYRLYPSKSQARLLERTLETCAAGTTSVSRNDGMPISTEANLQIVVTDWDQAFQAFFRRVKAGGTPGFPRFKGRNRFSSFGFKEYGNGFKIDGRRLRLSGIGRVAIRWHRLLEGTIKTVRISRRANKWYACFTCEFEAAPLPETRQDVGVDVGVASLLTTSAGEKEDNPAGIAWNSESCASFSDRLPGERRAVTTDGKRWWR